jgi:hypothetical protein
MTEWTEELPVAIPSSFEHAEAPRSRIGLVRALLILFLVIGGLQTSRQALWYFGFPVPLQTIATVLGTALPLVSLAILYVASITFPPAPMRHAYGIRVGILFAWSVILLILGLLEDHYVPFGVIKEFAGFLMLPAWLLLGRRDEIWQAMRKPLVILFYASLVLILLTTRVPAAMLTAEGFVAGRGLQAPRNLDTVAYSIRGIIDLGPLLFAWGMANTRKDIWRVAMIAALGVYACIDGLLFEFRGAAAAAIFLVLIYFMLSSVIRGRIPVGPMIGLFFLAGIVFVIASQTQAFNDLMRRFEGPEGIFDSRIDEAHSFFDDMGPVDLLIGRGFAGTYAGPSWAPMSEYKGRLVWGANHFGFLGLVLRGGVFFLCFVATFALPYVLPKPRGWFTSEYNVAAMIVIPMMMFNILFNPFDFNPDSYLGMMLWGLCFGRLSTPAPENSWHQTTPPPAIDSGY